MYNELYHHGILGQRWGIRRFQPYPKGSSSKGKFIGSIRTRYKQKKLEKKRNENLKKAREKAAENRRLAADKDRVLKSGSATEVLRYKGKLTNKELQDAVTRISLESKLSEYSKKEIKTGMDKIDSVMKNVEKVTNWTNTGTKAWNQMVDIYNSTEEGRRRPLRKINSGGGGR